jgi:hypothetical protein
MSVNVGSGVQALNLWMREDGLYIDKILLTSDMGYVPAGMGPAESPRSSAPAAMRNGRATDTLMLNSVAPVDIPDSFVLDGNYPNPFNPTTTIRFGLPEASMVSLVIYDVQGREVKRLLDMGLSAGYHQATWDASLMPSGIYIYRLESDEGAFLEIGKMVLVK